MFPTYIGSKTTTDVDNATAKINAITTYVNTLNTAWAFDKAKIPDAVYNLLHQYDAYDPNDFDTNIINNANSDIQAAIAMANATTSAYLSALTTIATAKTNSTANNPANIAATDISEAETALEEATTTAAIEAALAKIKKFDAISISGSDQIVMGNSITNPASATSGRAIAYSSSSTSVLSVSGTTLNALAPGTVTVTATTSSTGGGYYRVDATRTYYVLPIFYFEASAASNNISWGTATVTDYETNITGTSVSTASATTTPTYTATPALGYSFLGWGTTSTATTFESTSPTYTPALTNDLPGETMYKTLYAIFAPKTLTLSPTAPSVEEDFYKTVTLQRSFSAAGYYSIALPFSTTVAALTARASADDWVAQLQTVTYNAEDGYTLYFNKMTDGAIAANQPYILHLGTAVSNPQWTDVTVSAPEAATVAAQTGYGTGVGAAGSYSDWSMTSNFEAGMNMSGKYGVVNSLGALQRGSSTSTLNAFSAYITPPSGAAGVKVRSAFTDEFGLPTYINGLPDETTGFDNGCLYDLSGRKVSARTAPARGIYFLNQGRRILIK